MGADPLPASRVKLEADRLQVVFGRGSKRVEAVRDLSFSVRESRIVRHRRASPDRASRPCSGRSAGSRRSLPDASSLMAHLLQPPRDRAFARKVQMVFQDPYASLHPRHTVDGVLSEPLAIHRFDEREHRILRALEEVGLEPKFRFRFPHQLSGGQRQRVAIARALILSRSSCCSTNRLRRSTCRCRRRCSIC